MLTKTKHRGRHNLESDIAKIKASMYNSAYDVKDSANDILADSMDLAKKKSTQITSRVQKYAHKKPLRFLGIGFASGLCLGFLLKRF